MKKCVQITFSTKEMPPQFLQDVVKKHATKLELEGTAQVLATEEQVKIVVHGDKEAVDSFVDLLHKGVGNYIPHDVEIEPEIKDKDYRNVFRIIS